MNEHYQRRACRKMAINATLSLVCLLIPGATTGLDDGALAFTISSVSLHVSIGTAMMTVAWPLYFQYISGDLGDGDYDPIPLGTLLKSSVYGLVG